MTLRAVEVSNRKHLRDFTRLPARLYESDPVWIPPLPFEREAYFSHRSNPLFKEKRITLWVVYDSGQPVGRISAQIDTPTPSSGVGHFGCIEGVDSPQVFDLLFAQASEWLDGQGAEWMLGPFSLSINDECGLLVDGFEHPPSLMTPHGKPYYQVHLARLGFAPVAGLLAYRYDLDKEFAPKALLILARARRDHRIQLRSIPPNKFLSQIDSIIDVFNDGWSGNWGFEPIKHDTARRLAHSLRPLLMNGLVWVAEFNGSPAAVAITLPNLNEALAKLRERATPFRWLEFAWQFFTKDFTTARTPLIGIRRQFHGTSLGAKLALSVMDASRRGARACNIRWSEHSWVLESNGPMRSIIEGLIGGVVYKRYSIFSKNVAHRRSIGEP